MLHDYSLYADDLPLVRATLPHTRTVIDWFADQQRADGLLGRMKWWEFGDWTSGYKDGVPPQETDGGSALLTLQFIEALKNAADLEQRYGSAELASSYAGKARKASEALNRLNWDERSGLYADTPAKQSYSQQANALAVWLDVAPPEKRAAIMRRVLAPAGGASGEHQGPQPDGAAGGAENTPALSQASYYFRFYLARAMEHAGIANEYLDQLGPWYHMLELGLTTWAENPEPTRSDCHAWSASPNYDLLTIVAGIHPDAPGFKRVRIEPHLGRLTHLDATMPHPAGLIHVVYTQAGGAWRAAIDLPQGTSGSLAWGGHEYPLHAGSQSLHMDAAR